LIYSRGHFSLFKNNTEINNIYKSKLLINKFETDYTEILTKEKNCIFDETYGIFKIFRKQKKVIFHNNNFIDIKCNSLRFCSSNSKTYPIEFYVYNNGKLFHYYKLNYFNAVWLSNEYSYIHFQKRDIDFSRFTNPNSYYLLKSDKIVSYNSITELLNNNIFFFEVNLLHFIKRNYDRFLKRIGFRKFNFDNYLNTGNDY
jgi:hypothetical protein